MPFPTLEILALDDFGVMMMQNRTTTTFASSPHSRSMVRRKKSRWLVNSSFMKCLRWQMKFNVFCPINHYHLIGRCLMRLHNSIRCLFVIPSPLRCDLIKSADSYVPSAESCQATEANFFQTENSTNSKGNKLWQNQCSNDTFSSSLVGCKIRLSDYVRISELHKCWCMDSNHIHSMISMCCCWINVS